MSVTYTVFYSGFSQGIYMYTVGVSWEELLCVYTSTYSKIKGGLLQKGLYLKEPKAYNVLTGTLLSTYSDTTVWKIHPKIQGEERANMMVPAYSGMHENMQG